LTKRRRCLTGRHGGGGKGRRRGTIPWTWCSFTRAGGISRPGFWEGYMLWTVAVILVVLWLLGFFAFHIAGGLIHLLLVVAVVVVLYNIITGRRKI
jgi:hypothetical protein